MKKPIIIASLVLCNCFVVLSQQVIVNEIKVNQLKQNLSHNTVTAILQDSKGFMWFGTFNGLNKYDGTSITTYKNNTKDNTTITDNRVVRINEDHNGNLWFATSAGLSRYDRANDNFVQYRYNEKDTNSISSHSVSTVYTDSKGRVWVGCDQLCLYNPEKDNFTRYKPDGLPPTQTINGLLSFIYEDSRNNIWFVLPREIHKLSPNANKLEMVFDGNKYPVSEANWLFYGITQDSEGYFWIPTDKAGIIKSKLEKGLTSLETYKNFTGFDYHEILNTTVHQLWIRNNQVWFSVENMGVYVTDLYGNLLHRFLNDPADASTIAFNSVWSMYFDKSDRIWMGTWESGLSIYDPHFLKFKHYKFQLGKNSISLNNVKSFIEDHLGNIWIATDGGGLNYFDREKNHFSVYKHNPDDPGSIGSNAILGLEKDDEGNIWIGTWNGGINIFNYEDKRFTKFNIANSPVLSDHCFGLLNDGYGKMHIPSFLAGYCIYDLHNQTWELHKPYPNNPDSLFSGNVFFVKKDSRGNIWLCSDDFLGLLKTDKNGNRIFKTFQHNPADTTSISSSSCYTVFEDNDKNLWIGTAGGLNLMDRDKGTFTAITTSDGLPDDLINSISGDNNGNLWLGTNKGIVRYNHKKKEIRTFHVSDGLQGLQYNRNGSYMLSTGELLFGGTNGFNIFHPDSVKDNPYPPNIIFTDFKIFNKPVPIGKKSVLKKHISETKSIKLSYKEAIFTLDFVALNLTHPEENQYAFIMDGFETEWNYVGNTRSATYTNLNAGDYTFRVKAANNDGVWNEEGISIDIKITPPFWRTWWFILIVLGLIVYAIFLYIKEREKQANQTKEYLESKVAEGQKQILEKVSELEKQKEEIRLRDIQEQESRYLNKGLALFSEIISSNREDLHALANSILHELISFVGVQQGILFIHNQNLEEPRLEIAGSYACNQKILDKKYFLENEGYVGACFSDNALKVISDLPEGYLTLESGFGSVSPKYLIDIPISFDVLKVGVLELASLKEVETYKINFLKKLCENLASIISAKLANDNLKHMIEQNEQQTEELRSQEEEMRQNIEELQTTQEEFQRKEDEYRKREELLLKKEAELKELVKDLKNKEKEYLKKIKRFEANMRNDADNSLDE
ncbi:MAG: hypothetical protein JXB34_15345 [Bacteroidales bacterium]|nr:hypothetical protein [Bacteroidales bacterium]